VSSHKPLVLLVLSFCTCAAYAQTPEDKEELSSVTVESTGDESDLRHSPLPVTVIDAERFHGRNISLNEVLKRVAGVRLREEGGLGSRTTLAIHGLEGKRVKIFINGNPLNSPDGTFGINDIPIQLIQNIEIYKGVVPARFGGDALGGAVNIVLRDFEGSWVDLNYGHGSFDTQRAAAVLTKMFEAQKIEVGIGGFYNHAANDYVMKSPFVDGLKIRRDHDAYSSYAAGLVMTLDDRWFDEIELELVHFESDKEIQGIQSNIQQAKTKTQLQAVAVSLERADFLLDRLDFEYDFAWLAIEEKFIDKAMECFSFDGSARTCPGVGGEISGIPHDSNDEHEDLRHDLNLHYSINRNHGINLHLNTVRSTFSPNDPLASEELGYDIGAFPSDKTNSVITLSHESSFLKDALVNDAGIKYYRYDYEVTAQERALTKTPARSRNTGNETGWYESIRYSPMPDLYLKASYEHAFRLPDSGEVFGDGVTIISAPDLLPEEGRNLNVGVLFDRFGFYGMPWFKAEATYFRRDVKNLIKLASSVSTAKYQNLDEISV